MNELYVAGSATAGLEPNEQIRRRIEESKAAIKADLPRYETLVGDMKKAAKGLDDAQKRYDKNPGPKTTPDLQIAKARYAKKNKETADVVARLEARIDALKSDWTKLVDQLSVTEPKKGKKEGDEFAKYIKDIDAKKARLDEALVAAGIVLERPEAVKYEEPSTEPVSEAEPEVADEAVAIEEVEPEAEEPVAEEEPETEEVEEPVAEIEEYEEVEEYETEPEADEAEAYEEPIYSEGRAGVNLAPVNIDITSDVENAVAKAMEKFSTTLDARIEEYFANYTPAVSAGMGVAGSTEAAELQAKIANDEQFLANKLASIVEVLKGLNTAMATVTAAYADLDAKFKRAVDMQKQTNDMMRHTLREQQGVQVTQRVINQDQLEIVEAQEAMAEAQKAAVEEQAALTEAQAALAEKQSAVLETQMSLDAAMKGVMKEQKKVITAQAAITQESAKQLEAQAAIREQQAAITEEQKGMLTALKQTLKDQQAAASRLTETAELQRGALDDVKEILKDAKSTSQKTSKRRGATEE